MSRQKQHRLEPGLPVSSKFLLGLVFLALSAVNSLCIFNASDMSSLLQRWSYAAGFGVLLSALLTGVLYTLLSSYRHTAEKNAVYYPLLAGVLALAGMSLSYLWLGVWPFGEKSVMIVDMHHQYAPMLSELREMLLTGELNPLYTFKTGIGANFLSLFGYYLASPFNLLLTLFPEHLLTEGILVITLLKNALSAAFFAACVQYVFGRRDLSVVILSLGYSLSMYMIAYSWNIMWLDGVMMLPLIVLGFERMQRRGRFGVYILSLAYTLFTNYYIGFMICVFMVLYYAVYALRQPRSGKEQWHGLLRFSLGSLIGGGLSMALLIPVFLALRYTSAAGEGLPEIASNFELFKVFGQQLFGVTPTIRSGNLPNVYCGILPVVLLPIYLTMKTIPLRRRLVYGGLFAVVALSFTVNIFDLVWHGLHTPNDLPYRFSFIYVFVALMIAYMVLPRLREITPRQIGTSLLALVGYIAIYEMMMTEDAEVFVPVYVTLLLAVIYGGILLLATYKKVVLRTAYMLLALVMTVEMTLHGGLSLDVLNGNEYYTSHNSYVDNEETAAAAAAMDALIEKADEKMNGAFYRAELLPRRTIVDTALFHYPGLTSFSSSNYYRTTVLLGGLGYACNGVNSYMYNSFIPLPDSLLGIRYLALNVDVGNHAQLQKIGESKTGNTTYYLYENKLALPIAYRVDSEIDRFAIKQYDPYGTEEALLSAMTRDERPVYTTLPVSVSAGSEQLASAYDSRISINSDGETAWFTATVTQEGPYTLYLDCMAADSGSVSVAFPDKDTPDSYTPSLDEPYIIDLGVLPAGTVIDMSLTAKQAVSGNIYITRLNTALLEEKIAALNDEGLKVTRYSQNEITGTVNVKENGAMFTSIPYDTGWTVTVDGKKVDTYPVGNLNEDGSQGAFLCFDIGYGEHEVSMRFIPAGLFPGLLLTGISLLAFILLLIITHRKKVGVPAPRVSGGNTPSFLPPEPPKGELTDDVTLTDLLAVDEPEAPPESK